jgi:drug/metabolite transporter (DMT)-like permease
MTLSTINPSIAVIYGELVLSLYPIVIKTVNTNIFTQTLSRFLVFPILALAFGNITDFTKIWGNPFESFAAILHGLLNLGHVLVSYISYKSLPTGTAVSLFYLYPIFNIIIASIGFNESFPPIVLLLISLAMIGTYLIASSHLEKNKDDPIKYKKSKIGIIAGILSALTESIIFYFIRSNTDASKSPFYTINHLYPAGLAVLSLMGISSDKNLLDTSPTNWMKLIGFNAILGFTGYIARFYSIPKINTIMFSMLSFIGVISAYVWGQIFTKEEITKRGVLGGLLIASSISIARYFEII